MKPVLRIEGITKRFGNNVANDKISLTLMPGEIHSLLGENGAGKSTLMNVIYGIYGADEGAIYIQEKRVHITSPKDAIDLGIGMVHQHFTLVQAFTVAENAVLGMKKTMRLDMKQVEEDIQRASEKYDLKVCPHTLVSELSVGEQQRVEILKALYRGAKILILDEPTAVLTPQETDELFVTLKKLVADGMSIVFISHKLNEVMAVSDRISILRQGKLVGCIEDLSQYNPEALACVMVGRQVKLGANKQPQELGECVLELQDIYVKNESKREIIKGFSMKIHGGEIVGLAGVDGNGQSEFVKGITGLLPTSKGRILIGGKDMTGHKPRAFIDENVGHIPEDRIAQGLVLSMSVRDNLFLETIQEAPYTKHHVLQRKEIDIKADKLKGYYDIRAASLALEAGSLSGGNQQKVIVGRILDQNPKLLVAVHPTRGLDIGATEFVHQCLLDARKRGCAILLVSTDLDEIMTLSDQIAVIYEGKCMGILPGETASKEKIGLLMAGMTGNPTISKIRECV